MDKMPEREVKRQLREILSRYLPDGQTAENIDGGADIRRYGIDSVSALELFAEIESVFEICFDGTELDFACQNSIDSIAALVQQKL
jgi:acyl carrier protein